MTNVVTNIVVSASTNLSETLEILSKVNAFYDSAWTRLFNYTVWLIGLAVLIIPAAAFYLQWRVQKTHTDEQLGVIKEELLKAISKQFDTEKLNFEARTKKIEEEMEKQIADANAGTHAVFAVTQLQQGNAVASLLCAMDCVPLLLKTKKESDIHGLLRFISASILPELNKKQIAEHETLLSKLNEMLESISKSNSDGRYTVFLNDIKVALKAAQRREPNAKA